LLFISDRARGCGGGGEWAWWLLDHLPGAARAAGACPSLVIWHFQLLAA
jgi:hypothetical protein